VVYVVCVCPLVYMCGVCVCVVCVCVCVVCVWWCMYVGVGGVSPGLYVWCVCGGVCMLVWMWVCVSPGVYVWCVSVCRGVRNR
jgi:hypothetical protein